MYALLAMFLCTYAVHALACAVTTRWPGYLAFWLAYYYGFGALHRAGLLCSHWARSGIDWLRRLYDVEFTLPARDRLTAMAAGNGQFMFACEPHGPQCMHMVFGFAAHGSGLPAALGRRVRVAAHFINRHIPLVRDVFSIFGAIDAERTAFESALRTGYSLAVVPSGMYGKEHALLDPVDGVTRIYRRQQLGFLKLAAQYNVAVVPVLSDEVHSYRLYNQWMRSWPLALMLGRYALLPLLPVRIDVGEPLPTDDVDANDPEQIAALAERFYAALVQLAPPGRRVELIADHLVE
jgi:1-acyl-sn-glycerol-3-phosphate acyltransferase